MSQYTFNASAGVWGYSLGLRIPREVRDRVFKKNWKTVNLRVGAKSVTINLSPSFWRNCHELRNPAINRWLKSRGLGKWKRGNPPKIKIKHRGGNKFEVSGRTARRTSPSSNDSAATGRDRPYN